MTPQMRRKRLHQVKSLNQVHEPIEPYLTDIVKSMKFNLQCYWSSVSLLVGTYSAVPPPVAQSAPAPTAKQDSEDSSEDSSDEEEEKKAPGKTLR